MYRRTRIVIEKYKSKNKLDQIVKYAASHANETKYLEKKK